LLIGKGSKANSTNTNASVGDKTAFVVLKYTFKDGADNDEVALYLNPKPGLPEPSKPSLLTVNGTDTSKLKAIGLPQGNNRSIHGANSGNISIDEIRVGLEWGDVTPAADTEVTAQKVDSSNDKGDI
jgi:hypothetical protein